MALKNTVYAAMTIKKVINYIIIFICHIYFFFLRSSVLYYNKSKLVVTESEQEMISYDCAQDISYRFCVTKDAN